MYLLIIFVDQIDYHFYHHIFLFGAAFGNHQCQGNKGVVCYTFSAVCGIKDPVLFSFIPFLLIIPHSLANVSILNEKRNAFTLLFPKQCNSLLLGMFVLN